MFLSQNCLFIYLTVLQHSLHLIWRPSHVIDRFVSTYDQYRFRRPSLSTYAQVNIWMLFNYFYYGIFLSYKTEKVSKGTYDWFVFLFSFTTSGRPDNPGNATFHVARAARTRRTWCWMSS